jgi:glycyl-tRNA synthetase beta chain
MYQHYNEINVSIINAVLGSNDRDLSRLDKKIKALAYIVQNDGFKSNFSTFKRVANIVKDFDINNIYINENLLVLENEKSLYQAYKKIKSQTYNNYKEELNALFSLKDELDNFFESVMVNAEDEKIKNNRKSLIATIYMRFKIIADLKEISI